MSCSATPDWLMCNLWLVDLQLMIGCPATSGWLFCHFWLVDLQLLVGNVNASQTLARATTGASSSPPAPRGLGKHLARCRDNPRF